MGAQVAAKLIQPHQPKPMQFFMITEPPEPWADC